jgi:hypothetical protein
LDEAWGGMLTVISTWYNERLLAPLFLRHYSFADRIIIMLDSDTTDDSRKTLAASQAEVVTFKSPHGWDAFEHAERQMELYKTIKTGHVLFVDADEFTFNMPALTDDVYAVAFAQVFRHKTDNDIDYAGFPLHQRTHGVTATARCPATMYTKPCLIKAGLPVYWEVVGHHQLHGDYKLSDTLILGTHWQMADPAIAIERNVKNRVGRNSMQNKMCGAASHFDEYTVDGILAECKEHENDLRLF